VHCLCLENLFSCLSMGWLEEISFRDKPLQLIVKLNIHVVFYKCNKELIENTQTRYKQTYSCTQMFVLCGDRTRNLLRSMRVFGPVHCDKSAGPLAQLSLAHRLNINSPTKRGKKSSSDGHYQCEKEME
jgi:hypothetical protein